MGVLTGISQETSLRVIHRAMPTRACCEMDVDVLSVSLRWYYYTNIPLNGPVTSSPHIHLTISISAHWY